MTITKICKKCDTRQPLENFNEYEPGKKRNLCKLCQRRKTIDWETENKTRHEAGLESYPLTKTCYKCKVEQPRDNFTKDWSRKDGLYSLCKGCAAAKSSKIYKNNQESENVRRYEARVKAEYGITVEQKDLIFREQGEVCAVCKSPSVRRRVRGRDQTWPIDHDHKTGKVRGILCSPCNMVLGLVGDSEQVLLSMVDYIRKYTANNKAQMDLPGLSVGQIPTALR